MEQLKRIIPHESEEGLSLEMKRTLLVRKRAYESEVMKKRRFYHVPSFFYLLIFIFSQVLKFQFVQ